MILKENIENWAQKALSDDNHFLVGTLVAAHNGPQKVTIIMDGDRGVTIDDCAAVSRKLLSLMEEQGVVTDNFTLEVTTPGVDHPLRMKRQYVKNIGRELKVTLNDKNIERGKLVEVGEETISLEQEEIHGKARELKRIALSFSEIERAIVQVSFK